MLLRLEATDPLIDVLDVGGLDRSNRVRGNSAEPLAQAIPLLLRQAAFGVALVSRVREEQRHHLLSRTNLGDTRFFRAMTKKPDPILALVEALVHRLDLRLAEVCVGNREALRRIDQARETFDGHSHRSLLSAGSDCRVARLCGGA